MVLSSILAYTLVDTLRKLYWLPVQCCIKFKLLTFKALYTGTPPYLSHLLIPYCPSLVLRSSSFSNLLQGPSNNLISVPALSAQQLQLFGILFPTPFIRHIPLFQVAALNTLSVILQHLQFTDILLTCLLTYLLTYLLRCIYYYTQGC